MVSFIEVRAKLHSAYVSQVIAVMEFVAAIPILTTPDKEREPSGNETRKMPFTFASECVPVWRRVGNVARVQFNRRHCQKKLACVGEMRLVVETLPPAAAEIGLTVESIQAAVESRLRSARLYDPEANTHLYMNVNTSGNAFNVNLEYLKLFYDPPRMKLTL